MDVDVGILSADRQQQHQPASDGAVLASGEEPEPSCRWDVFESLHYADYTGSCCFADKADGTTLSPAMPSAPGLRINGVGNIPLPMSEWHVKTLRASRNMQEIEDGLGSYHKVYSVEGRRVRMKNPTWESSLRKLTKTAAYKLGVDPNMLSAELDMLMLMEKGSYVDRCSNADEGNDVLGTLFVQLPSLFTGGKISIFHGDDDEDDDDDDETMSTFNLGPAGDASYSCHFVCHYAGLDYSFDKVKSGSRVLLRYLLRYNGGQSAPTASQLDISMSSLKWSLKMLPPSDKIILIPFVKEYKDASLLQYGINALSDCHRSYVEAIKAAAGKTWKLLIITAHMKHTHKTAGYYGDTISSTADPSVVQIFDEDGNDRTTEEKWLKDVVNFDSTDEDDMLLAGANEEYGFEEHWGACTSTSSTRRYYERNTTKELYKATFLLAYDDTLSDVELKCLSGCDGVAEVTKEVVAARNFNLLQRIIAVVETKEKSKFSNQSCQIVLQMLTKSRSRNALSDSRIALVNRTISGLSTSHEPNDALLATILAAVEKFGHDKISTSIAELLSNNKRKKDHTLSVFLRRADFILNLNKRIENGSDYLEKSISDIATFGGSKMFDSEAINSTIHIMISEHGSKAMAEVVKATLAFMHAKISSNQTVRALLNRALLLWKLHDHSYDFIQACLVNFAGDFSLALDANNTHNTKILMGAGDQKRTFAIGFCYVMAHGMRDDLYRFGKWAIKDENLLAAFMEVIAFQSKDLGADPEALLLDVLNKCLVQNSTRSYIGWRSHKRENGTTLPSAHIRVILKDKPEMVRKIDGCGRLTLHHAVGSSQTSFEAINDIFEANPKAVSVRDPISGLYPFMLASSNDNVAASFSLLRANPSLIIGGTRAGDADNDNKKRKRSLPA